MAPRSDFGATFPRHGTGRERERERRYRDLNEVSGEVVGVDERGGLGDGDLGLLHLGLLRLLRRLILLARRGGPVRVLAVGVDGDGGADPRVVEVGRLGRELLLQRAVALLGALLHGVEDARRLATGVERQIGRPGAGRLRLLAVALRVGHRLPAVRGAAVRGGGGGGGPGDVVHGHACWWSGEGTGGMESAREAMSGEQVGGGVREQRFIIVVWGGLRSSHSSIPWF
jgi:hypothetical protein